MFRISIDSFVNIITNSSSVIYTRYNTSIEACYELLEEILKALGDETPVREVFKVTEEADFDYVVEYFREHEEAILLDEFGIDVHKEEDDTKIEAVLKDPKVRGRITSLYLDYTVSANAYLEITSPEKYKVLCNKVLRFLYSPTSEAEWN